MRREPSGVRCPAPTGPAITAVRTVTTGAGENYVYSDILGRTVQTNTQGFGGNWIYKTTQYDNLGRVTSVSHPYFSGETVHYTTNEYYPDPLGRLWKTTESGPGNPLRPARGRTGGSVRADSRRSKHHGVCEKEPRPRYSGGLRTADRRGRGTKISSAICCAADEVAGSLGSWVATTRLTARRRPSRHPPASHDRR